MDTIISNIVQEYLRDNGPESIAILRLQSAYEIYFEDLDYPDSFLLAKEAFYYEMSKIFPDLYLRSDDEDFGNDYSFEENDSDLFCSTDPTCSAIEFDRNLKLRKPLADKSLKDKKRKKDRRSLSVDDDLGDVDAYFDAYEKEFEKKKVKFSSVQPQSGSIRPESFNILDLLGTFKVGLDNTTTELLTNVINTLESVKANVKEVLPDRETYDKLLAILVDLKNKAIAVGDSETVRAITIALSDFAIPAGEAAYRAALSWKNFMINIGIFATAIMVCHKPTRFNIIMLVISIVASMLYTSSEDRPPYIFRLIAWVINKLAPLVPVEWRSDSAIDLSEDQPQAGADDLDDGIELITGFFASYVAFASGKNVPLELFRSLSAAGRVSQTLSSYVKILFDIIEKSLNWIRSTCFDTHSLRFLDARSSKINEFLADVDTLMEMSRTGMLFDNKDNIARVGAMIKVGEQLMLKIPRDRYSSNAISLIADCNRKMEKELKRMSACNLAFKGTRQEPVGVLIRSGPGAGKTTIMEHIYRAFCAMVLDEELYAQFKKNPAEFVYNRQAETKYWDKYTFRKWVCLFDDFLQIRDVIGVADGEAMDIIRAINTFEDVLHAAQVDEKGVMTFNSTLVVATTNCRQIRPHIQSIISPDALLRRFVIDVICAPRKEYCTELTKDGALWDRRFDISKLPICEYTDLETKRLPGVKKTTSLIPDIQEFYVLDNEVANGQPIDFTELMVMIMDEHDKRRAWHLSQKVQFDNTMEQYRSFYNTDIPPSSGNVDDMIPDVVPQSGDLPGSYEKRVLFENPDLIMVDPDGVQDEPYAFGCDSDLSDADVSDAYDDDIPLLDFDPDVSEAAGILVNTISRCKIREKNLLDGLHRKISKIIYGIDVFDLYFPIVCYALLIRDLKAPFFKASTSVDKSLRLLNQVTRRHVVRDPALPCSKDPWRTGQTRSKFKSFMDSCLTSFLNNPLVKFWNESSGLKKFALSMAALVSSALGYKIVSSIYKWFTGKDLPESFGFNSKGFSGKAKATRLTAGQLKAKHGVTTVISEAGGIDPAGSALIDRIIRTNCYELLVANSPDTKDDFSSWGFITFVTSTVAVVPYHFFLKFNYYIDLNADNGNTMVRLSRGRESKGSVLTVPIKFMLENFQADNLAEYDLALVNFGDRVQPHRNILKYFSKLSDWKTRLSGIPFSMQFPRKGGVTQVGVASAVEYDVVIEDEQTGRYILPKYYTYQGFTSPGDCGALFCSLNSSNPVRKIFGIHVAGRTNGGVSYASPVFQEDLENDLLLFNDLPLEIVTEDFGDIVEPQCNASLSMGQFGVLGKMLVTPRNVDTTSYRKSRLHGTYHEVVCTPARLRSYGDRRPLDYALTKYCLDPVYFDLDDLSSVGDELSASLHHQHLCKFNRRLLTYKEAVFGVDTVPELKGIRLDTSGGYPENTPGYVSTKKLLAKLDLEDPRFDEKFMGIIASVIEYHDRVKSNIRPLIIYTDFPKDETRPWEKWLNWKTRLVSGAPMNFCTVWNIYFGSFIAEFINNRIENGSAVGVNVYGMEWDHIARKLSQFDGGVGLVGAGDYVSYDGSEKPDMLNVVRDLINDWYDDSPENKQCRRIIWLEITNSKHVIYGLLVEWFSSMPSGNPGTPYINTLVNKIAFRLCFRDITSKLVRHYNFDDCVYVIIYGDDNAFTVCKDLRDHFNEITLAAAMSKYGLTYTTEFKGTALTPFRKLNEIEFLKRGFRYLVTENRWVAPLRLEVILNTPCWTKKGSFQELIPADNIVSSLRELSLHPVKVFNEWAPKMIQSFELNYPNSQTSIPLKTPYDALQSMVLKSEFII